MTNMGLKNTNGVDMKEVWKDGVWTYLGMMTSGFPNMFMVFSPQGTCIACHITKTEQLTPPAPTALTNGPTVLECQVDFVVDCIAKLNSENVKTIEPSHQAEVAWKEMITSSNDKTLFPFTSSWWTGGNVPGKKAESMNYVYGVDVYEKECREKMEGWEGFEIVKA